ncbi:MAG: PTS sugar transporter subunit IIB [Aerococcus sp.]|nr:PTS sugar transporter subunit IIB [Aerococcus sp.]
MGKIILGRVDERLIHGQVMMTLVQTKGVDSIFVVDDTVAQTPTMRKLYKSAGSRTGKKTIVTTEDKVKYYWDEYQLKDYNCILITRTIKTMCELVQYGLPFDAINIGGTPQKDKENDILVTKSVYMNKEDAEMLKKTQEDFDVDIYFQATPSAPKDSLESVLKKFDMA